MPRQVGKSWSLEYDVGAAGMARLLVSMPKGMLRDVHDVARMQNISAAELIRRALTERLVSSGVQLLGRPPAHE